MAVGPVERHDQIGANVVDDRRNRRRDAIERRGHEGAFVDLAGDPRVLEVENDHPSDIEQIGGGPELTLTHRRQSGSPAVGIG